MPTKPENTDHYKVIEFDAVDNSYLLHHVQFADREASNGVWVRSIAPLEIGNTYGGAMSFDLRDAKSKGVFPQFLVREEVNPETQSHAVELIEDGSEEEIEENQ